jgi:sialate O-acetylesterase
MINKDTLYILVKVTDTGGGGGIYGKEEELILTDGINTVKLTNWTAVKGIDFIANKIQMPYTPSSTPAAPSVLYNGMIHPLKNYSLRGVLLYHGTANAYRAAQYHTLFPDWISDLRNTFGNQELPVLYVQLAGFHAPNADCNAPSAWAELREAQRLTLQARTNTAMVVAYDLGEANDIHPKRKMEVGERLWLQANDLIYKSPSSQSGVTPGYSSLEISNNYAIVKFKNPKGLHPVRERVIGGFCIAGADKKWYAGEAQLKDDVIFVASPSVPKPVAVRYGWADFPTNANLYSEFNNPVSPFRTDNWPLSTAGNK